MATTNEEFDQLIRSVFERSSNPMLLADDHRNYTAANDAALRMLRYGREELLNLRIDDVIPVETRPQLDQTWCAFLTTGTLMGRFDMLTSDGRLVSVDFNATANVMPGQHLSIFLVPSAPRSEEEQYNHLPIIEDSPEPRQAPLRPREAEVLTRIALGDTGERVAADLGISKETVRVHIRNAMETLGANTRAQAIGIAIRDNLIELP